MSNQSASPPPKAADPHAYLISYRRHLSQTQAHLAGIDGTALSPSYIPPTGHWSSSEKNLFFHGLCVHSRLRPDLIAECIKTKTVVDVCAYLDILENAATKHNSEPRTKNFGIAVQVSDAWIEEEEKVAEILVEVEREWEDKGVNARQEEQKKEKKLSLRKPWCRTTEKQRDREGEKRRRELFKEWLKVQEDVWAAEGAKRSLGIYQLKALSGFLKADEAREFDDRLETALQEQEVTRREESLIPGSSSVRGTTVDGIAPAPHASPSTLQRPPLITQFPSPDHVSSGIPDTLSPASRRRLQKRLHMRRKRAEKVGGAASTALGRLKVGRKSAKNAIENGVERQVKAVEHRMAKNDIPQTSNTAFITDADNDQDVPTSSPPVGSPTSINHNNPHYRIRSHFNNLGISAQSLREEGLGLFDLNSLGQLMNIYKYIHDSDPESATNTAVSYDVLQHLNDHLIRFVTDVLEKVVVLREQQRKLKEHTKVWQFAKDLITTKNMEYALEMVGAPKWNRKKHFKAMLQNLGSAMINGKRKEVDGTPKPDKADDNGNSDSDDGTQEEAEEAKDETSDQNMPDVTAGYEDDIYSFSALYRDLYPPLIRLPPLFRAEIPTSRHSSPSAYSQPTDGSDEEAYLAELLEEDEIDLQDGQAEEQYEKELWDSCDNGHPELDDLRGMGRNAGHTLKFRKPDPHSRIKSQVYIYDSD